MKAAGTVWVYVCASVTGATLDHWMQGGSCVWEMEEKNNFEVKLKNALNQHSTLYSWWIFEWVFNLSVQMKLHFQLCKVWKCVKRVTDVHLGHSQEMLFVCNESLLIESTAY